MTQDRPLPPHDRPPRPDEGAVDAHDADHPSPPATGTDADTWRSLAVGAGLAALVLPAAGMVLAGLLVLAVQGTATWLVVAAAALVATGLGATGAVLALRRGHPGVVHRLAVVAWVWAVLEVVVAVVLALSLDTPERVGVAVLLILGGAYTGVLGAGLWGAARVMPVPLAPARHVTPTPAEAASDGAGTAAPRTTPPVGVTTDGPDDASVDWPEWGRDGGPASPPHDEDVVDAEVVAPAPPAPPARSTGPVRATTAPSRPAGPPRRSVASGGTAPRRTTPAGPAPTPPGPATERIARQDGDDGPPTQRLPPLD